MTHGPGKYDDLCTVARETAQAEGAVLIIADGKHGNGFSVQGPLKIHATLPDVLERMAEKIRHDLTGWDSDNARAMSEYQTAAYALLTVGKAAGALAPADVQRYVVESLRRGELKPDYFVVLRDKLTELLKLSGVES